MLFAQLADERYKCKADAANWGAKCYKECNTSKYMKETDPALPGINTPTVQQNFAASAFRECIQIDDRGYNDDLKTWVHMYKNNCNVVIDGDQSCPLAKSHAGMLHPTNKSWATYSNCDSPGKPLFRPTRVRHPQ